jgi:flagellar hook-associated protein 3 FlgL
MRVTFNSTIRDGLSSINTAAEQFSDAQWQVSTGKKLRSPSDDPAAAQRVIQSQTEVGALDAYTRTQNTANARLSALDSLLGDVLDKISSAMTTAESVHGTTADQTQRDAASRSIAGLRDALVTDINTRYNGTYLFSGSKTDTQPYSNGGGTWTYQGDSTAVTVDVDRGRSVAFTVDGQSLLKGSDPADLLTTLDTLVTATQAGDNTTTQSALDSLQNAFNRVTRAQSLVGSDEASVWDGQQRVASLRTAASTQLSQDQDANLADAITRMNRAQTTYQAALGAVSTASKVSLLDYLR